ncbi:hypothetical protein ACFO3O_10170 [Dokdonia ponticola]|uniref:Glycosyltransferase RgtA/B/C/D-like domain-containing protein n=1 Tax=Dokdonia ponticola TaxID=2041041 RepID=A0ABV9HVU4_9FLAO
MLGGKKKALFFKFGLILWTLWVLINYLIHHPSYFYAATHPPYIYTIVILILISIGIFFLLSKRHFKWRGWKIYTLLLLALLIIYTSFAKEASITNDFLFKQQGLFLVNNIALHLGTFLIFLCCFATGNKLLYPFKKILNGHHILVLGIALGMAILTLLLMGLAAISFLQTWVIIPILSLLLIWQRKACWSFVIYVFWNPINTKNVSFWTFAVISIILIFTAFNLVGTLKVFPLGYDGAGLYQNLTKNLIDAQHLLKGGQAYNWSLFTSLGPLLYGNMAFSIFLSHSMGILVMWAMFHLGRVFLSKNATWIGIAIFYTLPAISFHNFVDEKVDLSFLFICISVIIFFLKYGKSILYDFSIKNKNATCFYSLLGLLMGFALGIKYLGLLLIIGIVLLLIYQWGGIKAYIGTMLTTLSLLFLLKIDSFGYLKISAIDRYTIAGVFAFLGLGIFIFYFKKLDWAKGYLVLQNMFIISLFMMLSFMPWTIKNSIETGHISSKALLYGKDTNDSFKYDYSFLAKNDIPTKISSEDKARLIEYLGGEEHVTIVDDKSFLYQLERIKKQRKNTRKDINNSTGKREEILRYLGYETGLNRYLSLPYDVSMGVNIPNKRGVDIGFLFLLFLPLFMLYLKKENIFSLKNSVALFVLGGILLLSWKAAMASKGATLDISDYLTHFYPNSSNDFLDTSKAIYEPFLKIQTSISELTQPLYGIFSEITLPLTLCILILFCLLFAWSAKDNWQKCNRPIKLVLIFTTTYGFFWWILGNGIPHYALIIWLLFSLLIAYYYENISLFVSEEIQSFLKKWAQAIFSIFLVLNLVAHFSNSNNNISQLSNVFFEPFISHYSNHFITNTNFNNSRSIIYPAAKVLNSDVSKNIYRVGTYMDYHIKNSNLRVYEDSQLNIFDRVSNRLKNPDDFLTVLKLNNVKYIVFSLKVATIDQTPEKSLTDKATRIVKVLNNKDKIRLVMTNNVVSRTDPKTNETQMVYGLVGKTVEQGDIAIFEIL